jgi:hypothetical protein
MAKLKGTYLDSLGELVDERTGRLHTSFNQTVTATGRLSCLPAGTKVNTERGLVGIEEVKPGERIRTPYGPRRVAAWQQTGEKPVRTLRLANGITLRCSPDHRLRSRGELVRADEIEEGAPVYMSFRDGLFGDRTELTLERTSVCRTRNSPRLPDTWTAELAEWTGYLMADGHICHSNHNGKPSRIVLAFGEEEKDLMDRFANTGQRLFGKEPTRRKTRRGPTMLEISSVDVAGAFEQLGAGGLSGDLRVPPSLYEAPELIVAAFLRGYFEGYGHVDEQLSACSVSRTLLADVQQLLMLFGIPATLRTGNRPDPRGYAKRYTLRVVGDRSKETFARRVGFLSERKQRACEAVAARPSERSPAECLSLPEAFDIASVQPALYAAHRQPNGRVPNALPQFTSNKGRTQRTETITLSRAEQVRQASRREGRCSATGVMEASEAPYYQTEVADITEGPPVPMYDISVAEVNQYMAQGIVVHNSSNPNLQNVPVRTERGRRIRRAFVAEDGWTLMAADYAQIELRILAAMSGDEAMLETFRMAGDIHTDAAARVFDVAPSDVTRDQRRKAKAVNYGIPYGVSAWGLAQRLADVTRDEAEELIDQYRRSYPAVSGLLAELVERARERGYAETLKGRRRYLPGLTSQNHRQRSFAERAAVNMPIQGTQADMIKIAMVQIHERLAEEALDSRMLLQVHDELVFEVRPEEEDAARELVESEMREAHPLPGDVPVVVDIDTGPNWLDAH